MMGGAKPALPEKYTEYVDPNHNAGSGSGHAARSEKASKGRTEKNPTTKLTSTAHLAYNHIVDILAEAKGFQDGSQVKLDGRSSSWV